MNVYERHIERAEGILSTPGVEIDFTPYDRTLDDALDHLAYLQDIAEREGGFSLQLPDSVNRGVRNHRRRPLIRS